MRGTIHLIVQSAHLKYEMDFLRNITILKGDSATGKTTLVDMIQEYNLNGSDTGINLSCVCPCRVIAGNTWIEQLRDIHGSLIFIDEGSRFVSSEDFARTIHGTDNYYVIVTRESLSNLPYSVTEIYGIHSSGKYAFQEPVYHQMYRIYGDYQQMKETTGTKLLVEDSNAGYQFFSALSEKKGIECITAQGAGNIFEMLQTDDKKNGVTVIADGAAFGSQMEKVYQLLLRNAGIQLYLPESFEWIILSSGVLNDKEVKSILENPADYIDSQEYFSWENYFTHLLVERTTDTYLKYSKTRLNPVFLQGQICDKIVAALPDLLKTRLTE
jgi:hypothetical protein